MSDNTPQNPGNMPPPLPPDSDPRHSSAPPPLPPPASPGNASGPGYPPPPLPVQQMVAYPVNAARPGMLTAIGVLNLVGASTSLLAAIGMAIGTACCYPIYLVQFAGFVVGLIAGIQILTTDNNAPSRTAPILFILSILGCDVFSMTIGIVLLVLMNNPEVQNYYAARGIRM